MHLHGSRVSALGWGTHSLALLSFRGATYSREAAALADAGALKPLLDPRRFTLADVADAHAAVESGTAQGKIAIGVG